jgi:N-methylhydantoinase A/oxoprolinase/acetone carboxylase beta subunit
MVEAADIRTGGLGGDSEVSVIDRGIKGGVTLGPRRAIPISSLAQQHPHIHKILDDQLENPYCQRNRCPICCPNLYW